MTALGYSQTVAKKASSDDTSTATVSPDTPRQDSRSKSASRVRPLVRFHLL
jgi:hypothetical protein